MPTCSPSSRHNTHGIKVQPSLHSTYVVDMEWRPNGRASDTSDSGVSVPDSPLITEVIEYARIGDVRFTPESRHCLAWLGCLLSANSGHQMTRCDGVSQVQNPTSTA